MQVFIRSFGCSTNLADGEVLAGCLAEAGYKLVGSVSEADVIIYNTCVVKGPTENRIIEILKKVSKDKRLIVVGCLPLINYERLCKEVRLDGVAGPALGDGIVDVVKQVSEGKKIVALEGATSAKPSLKLPRILLNPAVSIIPINYGCLGSCAYCCVVFARGHLRSYGVEEIVERVKQDLTLGVRELWITSQDTACYGRDINTNLAKLLEAISSVDGDFRVRVGMMTPNNVMDILDNLVHTFQSERIFKFVHLPVQSGDDAILKRMRRFYSVDDFKRIVNTFRTCFPGITLATDVICGFPGENKEAFEGTLRLIEELKPDIVNVSKFFVRPRTVAVEMQKDFVSFKEVKWRSSVAARLARRMAFERNKRWFGWIGEIFIDEMGKIPDSWIGRNFAYKPIVIKGTRNLLAKTLQVKVVKTFSTHLEGEAIE